MTKKSELLLTAFVALDIRIESSEIPQALAPKAKAAQFFELSQNPSGSAHQHHGC